MSGRFNTILVPVDFSVNTEVAVVKALELIEGAAAMIHLLHVQRRDVLQEFIKGNANRNQEKVQSKLDELKERIRKLRPDVGISCWLTDSHSIEDAIVQEAERLNVDLIIIGKHSSNSVFTFSKTVLSSQIAADSGIPVLTVKPGSLNGPVKTVVIPVGPTFPWKKLELLDTWRHRPGFHIRLVSYLSHEKDDAHSKESLLNTFRLLKTNWPGSVEYDVLRGNNQAKALLNYCNKVNADMLIVYPGVETKIGGLLNRHISDQLSPDSRTQVLAVQPA
ncbi:MAG TPA: universal stress protein [Chitinophagaceae bacterium]|nr:universal stress protein [Chitinophagaceae bacterium]